MKETLMYLGHGMFVTVAFVVFLYLLCVMFGMFCAAVNWLKRWM